MTEVTFALTIGVIYLIIAGVTYVACLVNVRKAKTPDTQDILSVVYWAVFWPLLVAILAVFVFSRLCETIVEWWRYSRKER